MAAPRPSPSPSPSQSPLEAYLAKHPSFQDASSSSSPLPSLYADLSRQKRSNAAGYRANVEWWQRILTEVVWQGAQSTSTSTSGGGGVGESDRLVLHLDEAFKAGWTLEAVGRPLGLGTVVAELERTRHVMGLQAFLRATRPVEGPAQQVRVAGVADSAQSLLARPLAWALAALGLSDDTQDSDLDDQLWHSHRGDWVVYANLDKATDALLARHLSATLSPLDALHSRDSLRRLLPALSLSDTDMTVLLKHLERDRKLAILDKGIIKLSHRDGQPPAPVTEQDVGVVHIRETQLRLERQILELDQRIQERTQNARDALKANQKTQATSYLRSRKLLQDLHARRTNSLETVTAVLIKLEQAAGDVQLMQTYETSAKTLRSLLAAPELQHAKVDKTIESLQDALADHTEIDDAIQLGSQGARAAAGAEEIDDEQLAAEMEALALEKSIQDQQPQQTSIPSPPKTVPHEAETETETGTKKPTEQEPVPATERRPITEA